MEAKEIKIIIKDLKELFDIDDINIFSYETDGVFYIGKSDKSRLEVLGILERYFLKATVMGGFVSVDNITFVHTVFRVKEGKPSTK